MPKIKNEPIKPIRYPKVCNVCGYKLEWMAIGDLNNSVVNLICSNCSKSFAKITTYEEFLEMMKDRKG